MLDKNTKRGISKNKKGREKPLLSSFILHRITNVSKCVCVFRLSIIAKAQPRPSKATSLCNVLPRRKRNERSERGDKKGGKRERAGKRKKSMEGELKDINKSSYPWGIVVCKAFNSHYAYFCTSLLCPSAGFCPCSEPPSVLGCCSCCW